MYYKITKNGQDRVSTLTHDEALRQIAIMADAAAMETNHYESGDPAEDGKIIIRENGKVIFTEGEENAVIGDNLFEIIEDQEG